MVCYRFVTVKKVSYGENYGLGFCGETRSEVWQGKSRLTKASDQTKLSASALSNVSMSVEKWIRNGYLLNVATKCVILWNQKLWCGSLFLLKYKTNKEFCSLKHRIKKGMFFVVGKMNLFGSGRGGVLLPSPSPWLRACAYLTEFCRSTPDFLQIYLYVKTTPKPNLAPVHVLLAHFKT